MLESIKQRAIKKAGDFMSSKTAATLLSNPAFQTALNRAINLRSDMNSGWDEQLEQVARRFNLVTRGDVKALKKSVRELESRIASLQHELKQQRLRADKAEKSAAEARDAVVEAERIAAQFYWSGYSHIFHR